MKHLILFQIGPVQSFIAAARRTQDLYVGSRLLSSIAAAGVRAAHQAHADVLFPALHNGEPPKATPHRFAFLTEDDPAAAAEYITEALRTQWQDHARRVRAYLERKIGGGHWTEVFDRQVEDWLEIHWVAVEYGKDHGAAYQRASQAMAARRMSREFAAVFEEGTKCTLTGAQSALPLNWDTLQGSVGEIILRRNEALGALATIKRFAQWAKCDLGNEDFENFPSTDDIAGLSDEQRRKAAGKKITGYLAVLHMDGDHMGQNLSNLNTADDHRELSRKLSEFAETHVPAIIQKYPRAVLVYAGGDDVLALLPLQFALPCAEEIRTAFKTHTGLTMSAGIALTPSNLPLDAALDAARTAEHRAKEKHGRNAVAIMEVHRSGQIREAGGPWQTKNSVSLVGTISALQTAFSREHNDLSAKIAYDMLDIDYALCTPEIEGEARKNELRRLLHRRTAEGKDSKQVVAALLEPLCALGEDGKIGWKSLAHWAMLARFLAQGGIES